MAKVRLLEKEELQPGEVTWVQLSLNKPIALTNGDRFIIRSPTETLGGGDIVDSHAKRLRRFRPDIIQNLRIRGEGKSEEIIMALLESRQFLELKALLAQCDLPVEEVQPVIESLIQQAKIIGIGQGEYRLLFTAPGWERMTSKAKAVVDSRSTPL